MGKALRSNSKKAVRRSRRELFTRNCQALKNAEAEKQSILKKIVNLPRPGIVSNLNDSGEASCLDIQASRTDILHSEHTLKSEDTSFKCDKPAHNVTLVNAQRRIRRKARHIRNNHISHCFVISNCKQNKIKKKREKSDSVDSIEATLGIRQCGQPKERAVIMHDVQHSAKRDLYHKQKSKAPGSQWLKFKRLTKGKKIGKKPFKGRYKQVLKGITQYYPIKQAENIKDMNALI